MMGKKQIKEEQEVKELVAKNQEVIDALKRLSNNISQEISNQKTSLESENDNVQIQD